MDESLSASEWVSLHRRLVVTIAVLSLGGVVAFRLIAVGEWDSAGNFQYAGFFRNFLDGLLSTVAVSFVIGTFFWWVGAPVRTTPLGGEIPPYSIGSKLNRAAKTAEEWEYYGHVGRDARCRVLPLLGKRSREEALKVRIRFTIIDPREGDLCGTYADYRSRSRTSTLRPRNWDTETVQSDLLATIICLIRAKAEYPQLEVSLGLSRHFGLWRFDRSNDLVIVTQEEPQQPAYRYIRGSRFFAYHRQECEEAWLQSTQFYITPRVKGVLDDADVEDELRHLLGDGADALVKLFPRAFQMSRENTFYA